MFKGIFKIILMLILASKAYSQEDTVSFEVEVSKNQLGVNERLRVDFEMNKDGDNFTPPDFSGFQVVSGPNQSISHTWINGKNSFVKTYSYFLSPTGKGVFTIKQATVEISGKTYKTSPVQIKVTKSVNQAGGNVSNVNSQDVHIVAEFSTTTPYINQAMSVVYKLYFGDRVNVYNIVGMTPPKLNNFWNQTMTLPKQRTIKREIFRGKYYNSYTCQQAVLYPQKTGQLTIEPFSIDVALEVPNGRVDFFGQPIYERIQKTISTTIKIIKVKPLPKDGKPNNFNGAVGSFKFSTNISRNSLKATESLQAILKLSGQGNMNLIKLPELQMPPSIEIYQPESKESFTTKLSGATGSITDTYTMVPQYKGRFKIPILSFSYFDPKKSRYFTIKSDELEFEVTQGPQVSNNTNLNIQNKENVNRQEVVVSEDNFHFIKLKTKFQPINAKPFINSKSFFILLLLPVLVVILTAFIHRRKRMFEMDFDKKRSRKANQLARKYLSDAKKQIGQKEKFYVTLERALHNFLRAKLKIETSEFSKDKIRQLLSEKSVNNTDVDEFIALIESCEMARYAPSSKSINKEDYNKSIRIISLMDKQIG